MLEKANPNIGVSVYREFLLSSSSVRKITPVWQTSLKQNTSYLGVGAFGVFQPGELAELRDKSLTLEQFEGQPCILAFDLRVSWI